MASPYSTRFLESVLTASSYVTYTVPSGMTVVVRQVSAVAAEACTVIFGHYGGEAWGGVNLAAEWDDQQWDGRWVLNSGEELYVQCISGEAQVSAHGYVLGP